MTDHEARLEVARLSMKYNYTTLTSELADALVRVFISLESDNH